MDLGLALLALAPVLRVAAQAGDLFESGMKRRAGVKDSGIWLPAMAACSTGSTGSSGGCADRAGAANGADVTRKIAILGATGSIGKSTLDLVDRNPDRFEVVAVTAATTSRRWPTSPAAPARAGRDRRRSAGCELRERFAGTGCRAAAGEEALVEAAAGEADLVMAAIVGCAGLRPMMRALEAGGPSRSPTRKPWSPPAR